MNTWTDQLLKDMAKLREGVQQENQRQYKKWGQQTRTPFEWLTYLTEETGELAEAISEAMYRDGSMVDIQKEAIQVATLALKIAEMAMTH